MPLCNILQLYKGLLLNTISILFQSYIYPGIRSFGKPSTPTPLGNFKIINRAVNPGGPFGVRWLGLNKPGYGIHGTNNPASIGTRVSNGCIRMQNKDVLELANTVPIETPVQIINQ